MSLSKAGIHLQSIGILNSGFSEFSLIAISVATLQELLLAHIWVARAARKEASDDAHDKQQTEDNGTAHVFSKKGANAHTTTKPWSLHKGTPTQDEDKVTVVIPGFRTMMQIHDFKRT